MSCSTSEKLRRLQDEQGAFVWGADGEVKDPDGILPAFIAVVEESEFYLREYTAGRPALTIGIERALAALDEALRES